MDRNQEQSTRKPLEIAIISPCATVVPHFETELDIAQQHLDSGDSVRFFSCTGGLKNCDHNVNHSPAKCLDCVGRREMGLELLSPRVPCSYFSETSADEVRVDFESVEDLITYRIDDFDIGYAALSSVVSYCRDPEPDLEIHRETLNRFLVSAWQAYQQTLDFLSKHRYDRVYVFNGRFAAMRGVLRACQRMKVDCFLHERGCDGEHYDLFQNHMIHEIEAIQAVINDRWDAAESNPQRNAIAANWFYDRVNRVEKVWHSFVKNQESGRLPIGWNPEQKNISIFCSSDDEFVAIGEAWRNDVYPNQVTAIARIAQDMLNAQPDARIYLRVHPNLTEVDNQRKREMLSLDYSNLTVIAPDASIDTYELMRSSDTVVSFGSSVGSEAIFWGKPSVLLGPCMYQNLGGVYRSHSHAETIQLLTQTLQPQEKTGALKYGFWFQTRGYRHQYFRSTALFEGTFKDQTLYARPPKRSSFCRLRKNVKRAIASILPGK